MNGWGGADPTQAADGSDYELGTEQRAEVDITLTHIRVWAGAGELGFAGRTARVWSTAGVQLGTATLPDTLTPGWTAHALAVPVPRTAGQSWVVSYSTGGNYGALAGALAADVPSSDGNVVSRASADAVNGNGIFNTTPTQFPTTGSGGSAFYGIDVVYSIGITGPSAPVITSLTVGAAGPLVTATVTATDADTMVGATYRYNWGDGSADTVSGAASVQHTYTESGLYAVLVSVTDVSGLSDHASEPVTVWTAPAGSAMVMADVMTEIGRALDTIVGLRVHDYEAAKIVPPAAVVSLPTISWDLTYQRGGDTYELDVVLLVAKGSAKAAHAALSPYVAGSGAHSVKAAIEAYAFTSCGDVHVQDCEFATVAVAGTPYQGAVFTVAVIG